MLKLTGERKTAVCVSEMKDGDMAVIMNWTNSEYVGRIVQRYNNYLICVGSNTGKGWDEYFRQEHFESSCQVRILERGEILIVE